MTVIRLAAASRRRARLRPAPTGHPGTAPAPHTSAGASGRCRRVRFPRVAAAVGAGAALAGAGVAERSAVAASLAMLGHVRWLWIPAAIMLESASMAASAIMQRRLLAVGGASVGIRPMLATTYAANAVSASVPLAGPELATAFAFRRFTRQGADAPLAGWSLLVGGMFSSAAAALVAAGAGLASGKILVAAAAVTGGVLAVAVLAGVAAAGRRPGVRRALERGAARITRPAGRLLHRPVGDPGPAIRALPSLAIAGADRTVRMQEEQPAGPREQPSAAPIRLTRPGPAGRGPREAARAAERGGPAASDLCPAPVSPQETRVQRTADSAS